MHGTLHLTLPADTGFPPGDRPPTVRDVYLALVMVQRTLDLSWTSVPFGILEEGHQGGRIPPLPRYHLLRMEMASPLELVMDVPQEVLTIPIAITGLTLAIERVLNCKVRILEQRKRLEADLAEHQERQMLAEERIRERLDMALASKVNEWDVRATSAELHLEED